MSSGSICNESAIGLPLMVSGNSSISTSGRSPPMNSGVPGLVLGSNELVYRAKALHACKSFSDAFWILFLTLT